MIPPHPGHPTHPAPSNGGHPGTDKECAEIRILPCAFLQTADLKVAPQTTTMTDIQSLTQAILQFRDERDWAQFHSGKNLATLLSIEAGELLELFLWKQHDEAVNMDKLKDELADVVYAALLLAAHYELDVPEIVLQKLEKNRQKYPVEKAKGRKEKYDEL